ncbi:MAG: hypothetical protein AB2L12_15725 [Smithellaceae bacterium]
MNKYWKIIFCVIAYAAFVSCATGTAGLTKNWGKIVPDYEVKINFETYQVSPDVNYYISGSDVYPNAILGLNKDYTLVSTLWKKIELTEAMLKVLVADMNSRATNIGQSQFGFAILDNQGKQIGIWYSILSATAPVQMKENKNVLIYTPDQDTYEKHEDYPFSGIR